MRLLIESLGDAALITAFVAVMMITVEYLSVLTRGTLKEALSGSRPIQYLGAVLLGALPGCLGPFTLVTLYAHRMLSFGALVGAMIATSGDEAFVMLALFPKTALGLTVLLALLGLATAFAVDRFTPGLSASVPCPDLVVHDAQACHGFPGREVVRQWLHPSAPRIILILVLVTYIGAILAGRIGPPRGTFVHLTLILTAGFGGFIVATVPDHFLSEHLWRHLALTHVPRIFAWTLGVLVAVALLGRVVDVTLFVQENRWVVLGLAGLVGIIPESGPHLVFVTLFDQGAVPLAVLMASSIVQDGHGMLPLLAESRRDFLRVKAVNLVVGLLVGGLLLWLGT